MHRQGFTVTEILVALAILSVLMVFVGRQSILVNSGLENQQLQNLMDWEANNAREQIGCWPSKNINEESVNQLAISPTLQERLPEARWSSQITAVTQPAPALRVELTLNYTLHSQPASVSQIVFWVPQPEAKVNTARQEAPTQQEPTDQTSTEAPE